MTRVKQRGSYARWIESQHQNMMKATPHLGGPALPHPPAHSEYFPWFDWLRAICASAVMWSHGGVLAWHEAGGFAVQVFFALSGWLIGGILIKTESKDLTRFYFNRAIRIWFPYYVACPILLTLSVLREPVTAKWLEIVGYKLTFVYNLFGTPQLAQFHDAMPQKGTLSHVWSVNTEEQFYLIAPILLVLGERVAGRSPFAWIAIAAALYNSDGAGIPLGVLAALSVDRFGPLHLNSRVRVLLAMVLAACTIAFVCEWNYHALAPLAAICIVLLLALPGKRHALGELFGGMSYPLYLNHWIGLFGATFMFKHLHFPGESSLLLGALLQALINVPFAMSLYLWVDKWLLTRRAAWFTAARGGVVTATAYAMIGIGVLFGLCMTTSAEFAR
jgi:peptidoglycan/LPS O-acetylase OafA/YrhL